jgi:uncharacterized protein YutD
MTLKCTLCPKCSLLMFEQVVRIKNHYDLKIHNRYTDVVQKHYAVGDSVYVTVIRGMMKRICSQMLPSQREFVYKVLNFGTLQVCPVL